VVAAPGFHVQKRQEQQYSPGTSSVDVVCLNADPIPSWALPAISWDLCEALLLIPVEMAQRDLEPQTLNICADRVIQRCPRIFAVRPGKDAGRLPSVGQGTVGMLSRAWMEFLYVKGTEFRH